MKKYILILTFGLIIISCSQEKKKYIVDPELEPLLISFLEEGEQRGLHFNVKNDGLIMRFANLGGDKIGLCYHVEPLLIEFDSVYWTKIKGKKNEQDLKMSVVYHELGHGLLKRSHENSILPSGDWKTIMCGGEKNGSRNWNVNFYGFRKQYYLDELFNPDTPVPEWALYYPDLSEFKYKTIFEDDFRNNKNKWVIRETPLYKSTIRNREYNLQTKKDKAILSIADLGIDIEKDFLFEADIKMNKTSISTAKIGIVFGEKGSGNTNYFLIDNKKRFYIGNSNYFGWFVECSSDFIKPFAFNTLMVRKVKDMLYFYINGKFVYHNEAYNATGSAFGFQASGRTSLTVEEIRIGIPAQTESVRKFEHIIFEDSLILDKPEYEQLNDSIINDGF